MTLLAQADDESRNEFLVLDETEIHKFKLLCVVCLENETSVGVAQTDDLAQSRPENGEFFL